MDRRELHHELQKGFADFIHQMMYPEMSADYFEKMELRMRTDPIMAARVETLTAGVMHMLDKRGAFDE